MKIVGSVEDIIFKNAANGYTVLNIDYNGSLLTCVGKAININVGEDVELEGNFVKNEKIKSYICVIICNCTCQEMFKVFRWNWSELWLTLQC